MSAPIALHPSSTLTLGERSAGRFAVAAATALLLLTRARPHRIRVILKVLHRRSHQPDRDQAERAFAVVTTVSLRCASGHGCLRRSLALVLLCRLWGMRVTWRVGVCSPPPQSHAWVEADGQPVCELVDPRMIYTPIVSI